MNIGNITSGKFWSIIIMALFCVFVGIQMKKILQKDTYLNAAIAPIEFSKAERASIDLEDVILGNHRVGIYYSADDKYNDVLFEPITGILVFTFLVAFLTGTYLLLRKLTTRSQESEKEKDLTIKKMKYQYDLFNQMIENLPGVLFVKDVQDDYRMLIMNKAAEDFFSCPRNQVLGKTDFDLFSNEQASFFRTTDESVIQSGKIFDIPCEIVTTQKGEMFCHTKKVPIYDENNKPQYLIGLAEDITQRRRTEIELENYRENLENIVNERTEKLRLAIAKAEEANRLKSEFLATMSHEIRSPMSGVIGMAELLLDTNLNEEQQGLTKTILSSGEILLNIIEDILDFSKIEANKMELDPIAVNMLDIADDVCLLYSTKARDKALELAVRYVPGSEQFVYADPIRVRQVLGNLINNAIKFTNNGHIILTVREDFKEDLPEDKVHLIFSIEDTGIGINEKDQSIIFDKFSQANSSTTRNYGGTGLGLSICKKLIELMGGKISLKSIPGKGSVFEFHLPLTRNREEIFIQPKPPILKNLRVMVVDDLPVIGTMVSEQLSRAGMIVDVASNGHEALIKLEKAREDGRMYDILLIDYLMPGMNGEMFARAINDEEAFRDICLIMLTAAGNPILTDEYAEKGFSAYISKPVRTNQLVKTLAIVWERYQNGYKDTLIRIDTQGLDAKQTCHKDYNLAGTRILLVEDSRLNQAFAEEVLSQLLCQVVTVSNGEEALTIIQKQNFDLVLMDCQMPVMDGFEASRQIQFLKEQGILPKNLPVIALTANAMKGDRKRCIEAGMDDYLTKPVRKNELKDKIVSWIRHGGISMNHTTLPVQDHLDNSASLQAVILDSEILNEARALLKEKFDFMLECYLEDVENYIHEIKEALARKDPEALVRPAHTIKSTSKRMGALCLSDIALEIELSAREVANSNRPGSWDNSAFGKKFEEITHVFEQTRDHLLQARAG